MRGLLLQRLAQLLFIMGTPHHILLMRASHWMGNTHSDDVLHQLLTTKQQLLSMQRVPQHSVVHCMRRYGR